MLIYMKCCLSSLTSIMLKIRIPWSKLDFCISISVNAYDYRYTFARLSAISYLVLKSGAHKSLHGFQSNILKTHLMALSEMASY